MIRNSYADAVAYTTKDGSIIRELMHPQVHGNARQSVAAAILLVGGRSFQHRHLLSEEIYYILEGQGRLTIDSESATVAAGDAICIPPSRTHWIENTGTTPLRFLCCASPPYRHDDTQLIGGEIEG